jgi:hypothetical protein
MTGGWVRARTGAALHTPVPVAELALRRNPKRAHLLVSLLLGKHVPVPATTVLGAAADLGALVREVLDGRTPYVVGFAETATALGHGVAAVCAPGGGPAPYAHTTRRPAPARVQPLRFEEEHSHAVDQALGVLDEAPLHDPDRPLVLVDDELSSGRTAVNAIRVLQARWPRRTYVLATLLDVRSDAQRQATAAAVCDLGAGLLDVSLVRGRIELPQDLTARAAELVAAATPPVARPGSGAVRRWTLTSPAPVTGAFGWDAAAEAALREAAHVLADALRPHLRGSVLVMGDEEFMYAAQLTGAALDAATSTTTRSPALVVDDPGYPLRTALHFASTDDPARTAYAYNVAPSRRPERGRAPGFDAVVLLTDGEPSGSLTAALAGAAADVHVVRVRPGTAARVEEAA